MHRNEVPRDNSDIILDEFMQIANDARMRRYKEYQKTKEEGLTIRDRFALASISFFLDKYRLYDNSYREAIRQAYDFADAALEVRNESI